MQEGGEGGARAFYFDGTCITNVKVCIYNVGNVWHALGVLVRR